MKLPLFLVAILVASAIHIEAYSQTDRRVSSVDKRETTNADQMVQNILQWLQGVYAQNSRKIRQGTLREYLPPPNTEKPRPFQPGYPPAGFSPEPPFPFPTNPATGGVTAPEGYQPDNDGLLPPEQGSGGGENGQPKSDISSEVTVPTTVGVPIIHTGGPTTVISSTPEEQPIGKTIPQEQPGSSTGQPGIITAQPALPTDGSIPHEQPGYSTGQPGITIAQPAGGSTLPAEEQPGPFPTHAEGVPEGAITTIQPQSTPGSVPAGISTLAPDHAQPTLPPYIPAEGPQQEGTAEHATPEQPHTETSTIVSGEHAATTLHVEPAPGSTLPPATPIGSESQGTIATHVDVTPEQPGASTVAHQEEASIPAETPASVVPGDSHTLPAGTTLAPSGFTTSAPTEGSTPGATESGVTTTVSPEANTIPGAGKQVPDIDDEDLKHPPHIHAIDVQCSKDMMTIDIEFNREFNGIIYSKGYYSTPECRYVQENSAQTKYSFTVSLEKCGTEFVNAFDTQNQSYLENVLVLQNEVGIQEVWDTVRSVRCLWEGNVKDTLSVAFSIGMLSQEIITFSGDTAMAKLDVVLGRGPFGEPANGLVKIGEEMTLVVSVSGDPGFDLQVKDCKAVDSNTKNTVALTDEDGCILKPKLFGAFQKTRETGTTGASIIAYAYFNAFKFPDEMDLMIECNIELCKTDCDICSKDGQQLIPSRRRRDVGTNNATITGDWITMGKLVRVILPEDLNQKTALEVSNRDHICMTIQSFVFSTAVLVTLLVITSFISVCLWIKKREKMYLKY